MPMRFTSPDSSQGFTVRRAFDEFLKARQSWESTSQPKTLQIKPVEE